MTGWSRREAVAAGAAALSGLATAPARSQNGFMAASAANGPEPRAPAAPGLQGITALCEVTGGGEKVYGIAAEYDVAIDPAGLMPASFAAAVYPASRGFFPGMPQEPDKNAAGGAARPRAAAAVYTNAGAALRLDRRSVPGRF